MPPTTRGMTARGLQGSEVYAVRQKRVTKPRSTIRRSRFRPKPSSAKTMHGEIFFDREELQDSGSLESAAAESPTLSNEIHEFFRKEKFVFDLETRPAEWDEAYEVMKPAFRLVSRWITDPIFRKFWTALRFGDVEELDHNMYDDESVPSYKLDLANFQADEREELAAKLPDCFREYAAYHSFRFRPIHHAWAKTRSQTVFDDEVHSESGRPEPKVGWTLTSVTILHTDFLTVSYTAFRTATKSQQLRFLFFLAVNLAHELAHHVWQSRWATENNDGERHSILNWEPFFHELPDPHDELGIVWECFMFGGRIQPLNQSPSPFVPDGLVILHLDVVREFQSGDYLCRIAPLLTDWISDRFSETWWRKSGKKAARARRPGSFRRAPVRATVNRTMDSKFCRTNPYGFGGDSDFVTDQVVGGSQGHRLVHRDDDTWLEYGDEPFFEPRERLTKRSRRSD